MKSYLKDYVGSPLLVVFMGGVPYLLVLFLLLKISEGNLDITSCAISTAIISFVALIVSYLLYRDDCKDDYVNMTTTLSVCAASVAFGAKSLQLCLSTLGNILIDKGFIFFVALSAVTLILAVVFAIVLLRLAIRHKKAGYPSNAIIIKVFLFFLVVQTAAIWWIPNLVFFFEDI